VNCQQIRALIPAHHDAELDAANTREVEQHLADCPQCFNAARNLETLSSSLRDEALRFRAPAELRQKVRIATAQASRATREPTKLQTPWWRVGVIAAAAMAAFFFAIQLWPNRSENAVLAELTSSHVRSLMAAHLTDVASSDQHTVKPWFVGKLDFAPQVKDLRDSGFPLIGGRLDYIDSHPAAALVYARQKHTINLFIWPTASADSQPSAFERNGYHLIQWHAHGMNFWAVSDLNEKELMDFAVLCRGS
jgi:anti-sigma factor RsiW